MIKIGKIKKQIKNFPLMEMKERLVKILGKVWGLILNKPIKITKMRKNLKLIKIIKMLRKRYQKALKSNRILKEVIINQIMRKKIIE